MMIRTLARSDPFKNPLVQMLLHLIGLGIAGVSVYFALLKGTWKPIAAGLVVVALVEGICLYFKLRSVTN
jgi:hypothetical protein